MGTARNKPSTTTGGGTMNKSKPAPRKRILRIGILLNRTLVEERQMREHQNITIGQSAKNTFSIPLENLPRQFTIFEADGDHYRLNFTKGMEGRISDGGQPLRLDNLKAKGGEDKGTHWSWPLPESTRGKIEMGEFTLLFQFVAEPPRQPKPMLPASVRGTLADRLDPQLSAIVAISILLHFGLAVYARYFVDPVRDDGLAERAYNLTFKQEEYNVDIEPPPPPETTTGADKGADKGAEKEPDKKPVKDPGSKGPANDKPAVDKPGDRGGDDTVALQEQAKAFADMLASEDDSTGGVMGDMDRRKPGSDLGKQIADVRDSGKTVEVGGGSGRNDRGNGDPRPGTGKGTGVDTGGITPGGGGKVEKEPTGRISVSDKQSFDESNLSADKVLAKIMSAYMAGLKRCYKTHLVNDPSARGKVQLSFTVNDKGRAVSNKAKGFASEVDACIQERMAGWNFAVPKDSDGEATSASFSIALQLVPD